MKIIGLKHQVGTFKSEQGRDIPYDNYKVYCTEEITTEGFGESCFTLKMKRNYLEQTLKAFKINHIDDLIGQNVQPNYDRYGNCVSFFFTND